MIFFFVLKSRFTDSIKGNRYYFISHIIFYFLKKIKSAKGAAAPLELPYQSKSSANFRGRKNCWTITYRLFAKRKPALTLSKYGLLLNSTPSCRELATLLQPPPRKIRVEPSRPGRQSKHHSNTFPLISYRLREFGVLPLTA